MIKDTIGEATPRVKALREYYLKNSPMSVDRSLTCWKCHRSLMLYTEGWEVNGAAPTIRMRRSMAEAYLLENTRPILLPGELIVGQPDLTPFSAEEQARYDRCRELLKDIHPRRGRADHLALDYQLLLDKGVSGILAILEDKLAALDPFDGTAASRYEFYECCKIELEGLLTLSRRYAEEARSMAQTTEGREREDLLALASVLEKVPAGPATTFREALQSIHMFTWSLYGIYSFGKPDVYLLPYYRRDIENGTLTAAEAQELIDCFFLQSIPNMSAWAAVGLMLGGRDGAGNAVENELTWHFLTAIEHTHLPDPNVGFGVTDETGEDTLNYAAKLLADGHCQPQIWNSDEVTRSMLSYGFDEEAARMFTLSTCVEITPIGCSGISVTSPYINLPQIFLDALALCDDGSDFEAIFAAFTKKFRAFCNQAMLAENLFQLERGRNGNDPMRISVLIHDCLESGRSNDSGGARYNQLEPTIIGMQNVTESLNVIQRLVFEQKRTTVSELKKAIACDYDGYGELLSHIRNKTVHFGTGDPASNAIAKRVADMVLDTFRPMTTARGADILPGAFSYREHEIQGRKTGATPDGRRAGAPFNDGSCPVQGYDNLGPTLSIASTVSWEPSRFLGGTTVNVKLTKGTAPEKIVALIRGYLKTHGVQLQFTVVDPETLLDAQRRPEAYGDLLVRIGGYSDFFVRLPKNLQDEVISRTTNQL